MSRLSTIYSIFLILAIKYVLAEQRVPWIPEPSVNNKLKRFNLLFTEGSGIQGKQRVEQDMEIFFDFRNTGAQAAQSRKGQCRLYIV